MQPISMKTRTLSARLLVLGLAAWPLLSATFVAAETSSTRKYLLLDSRLIDKTEGVVLRVGKVTKHPANPLFSEDKPWEVCYNNGYPHVIFDEEAGIYKCWYNPFIVDPAVSRTPKEARDRVTYMEAHRKFGRSGGREFGLCYATSKDGLKWEKPLLDIVKWDGKPTNILLRRFPGQEKTRVEKGPHGCAVIKDPDDKDPARRYKMVLSPGLRQTAVSFSPDGIHWSTPRRLSQLNEEPAYTIARMPPADAFAVFCRRFDIRNDDPVRKVRVVSRLDTEDFKNWSEPKVVFMCEDRTTQVYIMPVFYYHGVYLGLPAIFDIKSDKVWTELTWSPDTIDWHRIDPGNPLLPNATRKGEPDGDFGCVYLPSAPVFLEDEIRLYYMSSDGLHYAWRNGVSLNLATLRPDGFAGYETAEKDRPGTIVTKPLDVSGGALRVSADVAPGGSIRVAVVDDRSRTLASCKPITKDVTDGRVTWKNDKPLSAGKIALEFELNSAKLYSFSFAE